MSSKLAYEGLYLYDFYYLKYIVNTLVEILQNILI